MSSVKTATVVENINISTLKKFVEKNFKPTASDFVTEAVRVHTELLEKFPLAQSGSNQLSVVANFRRVLYLSGKSRHIGRLYLPLVLGFMNRHRGKLYRSDLYDWYKEARDKYGFRNVTLEKIENAIQALNEREDLGWKDKIMIHHKVHDDPKTFYKIGANFEAHRKTKGKNVTDSIAEILASEEFKGWENNPVDTNKLLAKLQEMGKVNFLRKSVSNAVSKLRVAKKQQEAKASLV